MFFCVLSLMFHVQHFFFIHSFIRLHSFGHYASLVRRLLPQALFRFGFVSHSVRGLFGSLPFCPMAKCSKHTSPVADLFYGLNSHKPRLQPPPLSSFLPQPTLHRAFVRRLLSSFSSIPSFVPPLSFVHYKKMFHVQH